MKTVKSLKKLQDEIAVWHAALVIGTGYDYLKRYQPRLYKRMHRVAMACLKEASKRAKRKR